MPEISIVVPVYNVEKYLNKCVDSILNQTFKDFELILVDDGSTDNSGSICDEYLKKDDRIKVIHKENGGLSDARNFGIEAATAKYIGFVDSDDYIKPDMYEVLYKNIIDNDADVSVCGIYNCYDGNEYVECSNNEFFVIDNKEALKEVLIGRNFSVPACNKIYKKILFNDIRYPVGKLSEDAFTTPKLLSKTKKVVVTTEPKYYYVHRNGSITCSEFKMKDFNVVEAYEGNLKFVRENFPEFEKEAYFRYLWSYMYVLDKMLLTKDFNDNKLLNEVVRKLRKNIFKMLGIPYFTIKRKLAMVILFFNKNLYKKIMIHDRKSNMKLFD